MNSHIQEISQKSPHFPEKLRQCLPLPICLYVQGGALTGYAAHAAVAVVGSRKITPYGKAATQQIVTELAKAGVIIVSGLAFGVDASAHQAALDAGGTTIAVLPGDVTHIYPRSNHHLAQRILKQGGALVSEHKANAHPARWDFVGRNRLISGLADAVLITEAAEKSGSLHTARFALEQGKEVLAVPGNITSTTSAGTNTLLKSGAHVITSAKDVLQLLGITPTKEARIPRSDNPQEQILIELLSSGMQDGAALLAQSSLDIQQFNQALTMLEISGTIRALGGNQWALR